MAIRTINDVRNPVWSNYEQTQIDLEVDFDEEDQEYVPFTARADDPESHGVLLYNNAVAGQYGPIAPFPTPSNITGDDALNMLRQERQRLLEETDYIEMPTKWATLTAEKQAEWTTYRNALRDLPATYPNAELRYNSDYSEASWHNVTWPTKPS